MGTQSQTPGSKAQQPSREERERQTQKQSGGKDAGNVARSDDDLESEDAEEGTREDAAGSNVNPSKN